MYTALNGKSGGQQTKLTKSEYELMEAIQEYGRAEVTIFELQHITTKSRSVVYKMLHGTNSKGYHYSGLLEKCPAISVCDRTLVTDENGTTLAHRREKAYTWDEFVYQSWASDGGCWLVSEGSDHNNTPPSPPSDDVAEKWRNFPPRKYRRKPGLQKKILVIIILCVLMAEKVKICSTGFLIRFLLVIIYLILNFPPSDQCVSSNEDLESVRESG